MVSEIVTAFGRLELEWCEKKILLGCWAGWSWWLKWYERKILLGWSWLPNRVVVVIGTHLDIRHPPPPQLLTKREDDAKPFLSVPDGPMPMSMQSGDHSSRVERYKYPPFNQSTPGSAPVIITDKH